MQSTVYMQFDYSSRGAARAYQEIGPTARRHCGWVGTQIPDGFPGAILYR